jgi:hypothetical protein
LKPSTLEVEEMLTMLPLPPVPLLELEVERRVAGPEPRVVDQDVDLAGTLLHLGEGRLDLGLDRDVGADAVSVVVAGRVEDVDRGLGFGGVTVERDDRGAEVGEPFAEDPAEAGPRSGDDRHPAAEVESTCGNGHKSIIMI